MPQTPSILNFQLETIEDFHVRRIKWVEEAFRKEQKVPTRYALARRAMIGSSIAVGSEVVSHAIEEALLRLGACL
jgi:hypothetical protein